MMAVTTATTTFAMFMMVMAMTATTAAFAVFMIVVMMTVTTTTATTAAATTAMVLRRTDRIEDRVEHFKFQTDHRQNLSDGRIIQNHEGFIGLSHGDTAIEQSQSGFSTQFLIAVDLQDVFNGRVDHVEMTGFVNQDFTHLQNAILFNIHFKGFFANRDRCRQAMTLGRRQGDVSGTFQNHFSRRGLSGQNLGDLHVKFPFFNQKSFHPSIESGG